MDIQPNIDLENKMKPRLRLELLILFTLSITAYIVAQNFDLLEKMVEFSWKHENWELDELLTVSFFISIALISFSMRRWKDLKGTYDVLLQRSKDLQNALSEIKQLRGIIPICASCKKIRDDEGFWHQVESYVSAHTEASFSHGICPDCAKKLYPELYE